MEDGVPQLGSVCLALPAPKLRASVCGPNQSLMFICVQPVQGPPAGWGAWMSSLLESCHLGFSVIPAVGLQAGCLPEAGGTEAC